MISEQTRNIAIGLTVLVALILVAIMVFLFAGLPEMFQTGYTIRMYFQQTHDIQSGDPIYMRGKRVGVVTDVTFTNDDPLQGITIVARVDSDIRVPRNVQAKVFTRGIIGKGYLSLTPDGPLPRDPETGQDIGFYELGETIELRGIHDTGSSILPPEISKAMEHFSGLAETLDELLAPESLTPEQQAELAEAPGLKGTIARMNRTLDAAHAILGDEENQQNLQTALENLASASGTLNDSLEGVDEMTREMVVAAEGVSAMLTDFRETMTQVNEGEGTVGRLLRDPALYNNLVQVSQRMDALVLQLQQLVDSWEQKGMDIRLR